MPMLELCMMRSARAKAASSATLPSLPCTISAFGNRRRSIISTAPFNAIAQTMTCTSGRCFSMMRSVPGVWPMSPMFTVSQADLSRMVFGFASAAKADAPRPAAAAVMNWRRVVMAQCKGYRRRSLLSKTAIAGGSG